MYKIIKFFLFLFTPEKAHYLAMDMLGLGLKIPGFNLLLKNSFKYPKQDPVTVCGIDFPNKIGLAAGFDKNAKWLHELSLLGFGHVEVGTVTPKPQDGNPKPRLFRLIKDKALINRMGFNNEGIDAMVKRLKNRPKNLIVGGNIGKNKITPNETAVEDYIICFEKIYDHVDYIVVNVSSPNTPGLRELQDKDFLSDLFNKLNALRQQKSVHKPVMLKIAPDLTQESLTEITDLLNTAPIDAVIATNTTIDRSGLQTSTAEIEEIGAGGLSGAPLLNKSNVVIRQLRANLKPGFPIIGAGGVVESADALSKLVAGANLVQIYSGFIYKGPWQVKNWIAATSNSK